MTDRAADEAAIKDVIALQERAFNTKDPELFARPWRERSWGVSVTGVEAEGREAIRRAAEVGFAGFLADQYATYATGPVELLGDDAAIVHVYARATDADGAPTDPDVDHTMVALYVLAREDDRWQIVARQNTLVAR
jgi:uncharacterized protein (TIGR02246 family)